MFRKERHDSAIRNKQGPHCEEHGAGPAPRPVAGVSPVGSAPLLAPSTAVTVASTAEPAISVRRLWKVFGPKAAQGLAGHRQLHLGDRLPGGR